MYEAAGVAWHPIVLEGRRYEEQKISTALVHIQRIVEDWTNYAGQEIR